MSDDLRSAENLSEPLSGGNPNLRDAEQTNEPLSGGHPNLLDSEQLNEPLSGGYPNLRAAFMVLEALTALLPEPYMSTEVFPTLIGVEFSVHKKPTFSTRISKQQSGREVRSANYPYPLWEFNLSYDYLPDESGAFQQAQTDLRTLMGFFLQMTGSFDTFLFKDPTDYIVVGETMFTGDAVTVQFPMLRNLGGFNEPIGQLNVDFVAQFLSTDVNTGTSSINVPNHGLTSGYGPVSFSTSNTLPTGLSVTSTYWLIAVDKNTLRVAASYADALAGTYIALTGTGSGTDTINRDIAVYDNGTLLDKTVYSVTMPNQIVFVTAPASGHVITADFWFYFVCRFLDDSQDYEQFADKLYQLGKCDFTSVIGP